MTNKKKGNAFTNNPIVRAIGVQKIVVVVVLILLLVFFSVKSYLLLVLRFTAEYYGLHLLSGLPGNRRNLLPDHRRRGSFHRNRNVLLCSGRRLPDYKDGPAGYRGNSGDPGHGNCGRTGERPDCIQGRARSVPGDAVYDDDCPRTRRHHHRRLQYHLAHRGYAGRLDEKSVQVHACRPEPRFRWAFCGCCWRPSS